MRRASQNININSPVSEATGEDRMEEGEMKVALEQQAEVKKMEEGREEEEEVVDMLQVNNR